MTKMLAYHNNPEIKEKYMARVQGHAKADEFIHGTYWENGKGCAVGCTIHSSDHMAYETELGIPVMLARLEDVIFENLPNGKSKEWPELFLSSIPVGADLSMVGSKFMHWILIDPKDGVIRFAKGESKKAVEGVANLYQRRLNGDEPSDKEWAAWAARAAWAESYQKMADKLIELLREAK